MGRKVKSLAPLCEFERDFLKGLREGKDLNTIFAPMMKRVMEVALSEEADEFLATQSVLYDLEDEKSNDNGASRNYRNGYSHKHVKSSKGNFELSTPRDRHSEFEPQIIGKRQTILPEDLEVKILNLYANGMSYSDIQDNLCEIYQTQISVGMINKITDKLLPEIKAWQERPLEAVYPIVFLDAIHFKVREDGAVKSKAIYTMLGIDLEGRKDILGLYISESEGASYWASTLAELKQRGVQDILIACTDGLKGFEQAVHSVFPKAELQLCVVHQIRNSLKYVASKDQKAFIVDLKTVYQAVGKQAAEANLNSLNEKWGKKYKMATLSWLNNWENISTYFKYDHGIRKLIYTTNAVEGVHRMVRKYTKPKAAFTSENALVKLVFCAYNKISKKWTMPIQNWAIIRSELACHFEGRC
jgi:transposase-like protein